MHRINEEDREKIYEALKEKFKRKDRETNSFEVEYKSENEEFQVFRMVTKFDNSHGIADFNYKTDYKDENDKDCSVIQLWTIDIPNEMMKKTIEILGSEEALLSNYSIIKTLRENEIEGTENLTKWFIKHLEINELLKKDSTIKVKHKEDVIEEDTEYHGGTYDV